MKNQGGCGSCWAFAAATVQESMQASKTEKPVVRLSEQEGVECDDNTNKCEIDELFNANGAHTCSNDSECRGNRQCGTDGMCYGYCGYQ